jgi:hypothetical protein
MRGNGFRAAPPPVLFVMPYGDPTVGEGADPGSWSRRKELDKCLISLLFVA